MAIAVYFNPASMTASQYDQALRGVERATGIHPPGRLYHVCFGSGDQLKVFDVWDSIESFQQFGATLMPILQSINLDPGEPSISEVHHVVTS
jgi:hypothetical protein